MRQNRRQADPREGIQLFHPHNRDILDALVTAFLQQIIINLAGAQHDATDFLGRRDLVHLINHMPETTAGAEFRKIADGKLMPQQGFRRHHHQGLAVIRFHLPAQRMIVIGRRREVADAHIALSAKLQIAFKAGGGMFRPLPFIPMRQQHHQARHAQPLGLTGCDELINDHLRAIGEVTKLAFPEHHRLRIGQRIAIVKTKHAKFREQRIESFKLRLTVADIIERRVFSLACLINQHRMAMAEGAALHIFA